jgi:hypothetical protein
MEMIVKEAMNKPQMQMEACGQGRTRENPTFQLIKTRVLLYKTEEEKCVSLSTINPSFVV